MSTGGKTLHLVDALAKEARRRAAAAWDAGFLAGMRHGRAAELEALADGAPAPQPVNPYRVTHAATDWKRGA